MASHRRALLRPPALGLLGVATLLGCSGGVSRSPDAAGGSGVQPIGGASVQATVGGGGVQATVGGASLGGTGNNGGGGVLGGTGGAPDISGGGRRAAIDTCGDVRPPTYAAHQSCANEGFACYYQLEEPQNVQNYFIAYTCCCGEWLIMQSNEPSRSFSCEEARLRTGAPAVDCSAGGAGGAANGGGAAGD
jgi:hypothetical protein